MLIRFLIFFGLAALFEVYAFQAFRTLFRSTWLQIAYGMLSIGIWIYMMYVFTTYDRSVGPTQQSLKAMGIFLLSVVPKLVIAFILIFEDLVRLGVSAYSLLTDHFMSETSQTSHWPARRKFISQLAIGLATIPFGSLLYGIYRGRYNYKVLTHTLYFDDLPEAFDGFRLTQISDIHSGSFTNSKKIKYAVDLINNQRSDMIVFTGDIVNTRADEMDNWITVFKNMNTPAYGKFSILGNHDYGEYVTWPSQEAKEANFQAIKDVHKKIDFDLLLNSNRIIEKDGQHLALIGVENWGHNFKKAGDLIKASSGIAANDFKILLSHDPSHWEYEVRDHPETYHLTLSGHTHGFQFGIEVPGIKWSPVQYVYQYWAGLYKNADRYLYVNRGFGYHAYPGRVGIWPEITVLELKRKPSVA